MESEDRCRVECRKNRSVHFATGSDTGLPSIVLEAVRSLTFGIRAVLCGWVEI